MTQVTLCLHHVKFFCLRWQATGFAHNCSALKAWKQPASYTYMKYRVQGDSSIKNTDLCTSDRRWVVSTTSRFRWVRDECWISRGSTLLGCSEPKQRELGERWVAARVQQVCPQIESMLDWSLLLGVQKGVAWWTETWSKNWHWKRQDTERENAKQQIWKGEWPVLSEGPLIQRKVW